VPTVYEFSHQTYLYLAKPRSVGVHGTLIYRVLGCVGVYIKDTVNIVASTANSTPVANAGPDQSVIANRTVNLDGSGSSDADGDGLAFTWNFVSRPNGSSAALDNARVVNPSFNTDFEGSYVVSLVVSDGLESSVADNVQIEVIEPRVKLFRESGGFIGGTFNEVALPYSSSTTSSTTVSGIPAPTTYSLDTFKFAAQGQDFTIVNLTETDNSSQVVPFFDGISDGDTVAEDTEVTFELVSPLTGGATVNLNFSFEILETGETFSASYVFTSN